MPTVPPPLLTSSQALPSRHPPSIIPPPPGFSAESEVDFSPSVGTVPLHPVPASSNGGATLDWTGTTSDEERGDRRWSISIKRKHKEKPVPNRAVIEKQDTLYADRLSRIRAKLKPNTIRKVEITKDQLERRYAALLTPPSRTTAPINLLGVVRWYNSQDEIVRNALDRAEPLTWLRHLRDKSSRKDVPRLPWHLTALIIEEYVRSKMRPEVMETIPEDRIATSVTAQTSPVSNQANYAPDKRSPSSGSWSYTQPYSNLEPSLSRRKASIGDQVSFEPHVESGRASVADDRGGSLDQSKATRVADATYSPRSSINSSIFHGQWTHNISPTSSRLNFREIAHRIRRKPYANSEDDLSSARNSISEQSHDEHERPRSASPRKRPVRRTTMQMYSRSEPGTDDDRRVISGRSSEVGDRGVSSGGEGPVTAKQTPSLDGGSARHAVPPDMTARANETAVSRTKTPRIARKRISLPSPHQFFIREKEKQQRHADEEHERREYERKAELLEDMILQNHHTRQLLLRTAANVREYEKVQSGLAALLGLPYNQLSQEMLDALTYDPGIHISGARRMKSWRVIDESYERNIRQHSILQAFLGEISESFDHTALEGVFDDPIASLSESLEQLELQRQRIVREAETVAEQLTRVKSVHGMVKKEYNDTMGHTSLVYPELSQIATLEESYRNHYQQLWNLGLDALTLLLDTVTPVWRIYGKVIGEDIQDFLIIPWYRNEFTGEPKPYPITRFPRRSFRHWVGLLMFSCAVVLVTTLQIRAAWSSTLNYSLPWISHVGFRWMFVPIFCLGIVVQWFAVLVEISIVVLLCCVVVWWLGWFVRIFS
ncbi:hypothetical protein K474DRAFT_1741672 [Panus rudis PR-1116 ss-1]|nr:hypothetical protein K474DRAFT_1741672 [Panus rudis PR-1116 ss-1]